MKRWAFTILLFLILGAVVNVAVAWATALWSNTRFRDLWVTIPEYLGQPTEDDRDLWRSLAVDGADAELVYVDKILCSSGVRLTLLTAGNSEIQVERYEPGSIRVMWNDRAVLHQALILESGWPAIAMFGYRLESEPPTQDLVWGGLDWRGRLLIADSSRDVCAIRVDNAKLHTEKYRFLPIGIAWWGFLSNVIFFAAPLALLYAALMIGRRSYRIRRGRCPKCGYDLRGAPSGGGAGGCPECGWGRRSQRDAGREVV